MVSILTRAPPPWLPSRCPTWHRKQRKVAGCCSRLLATVPCGEWQIRAVFRHGRVLVGERTLFLGMALPAQEIERFRSQVAFHLAMRVVAIAAEHLAFLHGMMRRHRELGEDVGVALVADDRVIDRHRQAFRASDVKVADADDLRHVGTRVRRVAIGAGDSHDGVRGRMPGHGR